MKPGFSNDRFLELSMSIFAMLLRTKESGKWLHGEEIGEKAGIDKRIVADIVRCFQRQGFPIISGDGYKWAKSRIEFYRHLVKERQRAQSILHSVSEAKKKSAEISEPTLFDQVAA